MSEWVNLGYGAMAFLVTCTTIEVMTHPDSLETIRRRWEKKQDPVYPSEEKTKEAIMPEAEPTSSIMAVPGLVVLILSTAILIQNTLPIMIPINEFNQTLPIQPLDPLEPLFGLDPVLVGGLAIGLFTISIFIGAILGNK